MGEKGNNEACITLVVYPCGEVPEALFGSLAQVVLGNFD